jgi:hypothetical protein
MSKDPYYFTHDANASSDPKMLAMLNNHGVAGYGMFWIIIERLRNESGYKLADKQYNWDALAMQMHSKTDTVRKFVDYCCEIDLLVKDDGFFYSPSLLKRMIHLDNVRSSRKRAAESRWDNA